MDYELQEKIEQFVEATDDVELTEVEIDFETAGSAGLNLLMERVHVLLESPTMDETDSDTKRIAFELLSRVAESHYDTLQPYAGVFFSDCGYAVGMAPGGLSFQQRSEEPDEVKAAALEFLVNVALEERQRADNGTPHANLIVSAAPQIVPVILHALLRLPGNGGEDDQRLDFWNVRQNILSLISLIYASFGTELVEKAPVTAIISPFVLQHAHSHDWKQRQAGLLALGAAASADAVDASAVVQLLPVAAESILSPVHGVRDAAIWAMQNLAAADRDATANAFQSSSACAEALVRALSDPSSPIASQAITTIQLLSSASTLKDPAFISALLTGLMTSFDRDSSNADSLRDSVSSAFAQIVANAPADFNTHFVSLAGPVFSRLSQCLNPTAVDRSLLPPLSVMFSALAKRVDPSFVGPQSDSILSQVLHCLKANHHDETVRVSTAIIISGLSVALGDQFERFAQECLQTVVGSPPLMDRASAMTVSSVAKALGPRVLPFAHAIMHEIFQALHNPYIALDARASLTLCVGDVCFALSGAGFAEFLAPAINALISTANQTLIRVKNQEDEDDDPDTTCDLLRALLLASGNILRLCVIGDKPTEATVFGLVTATVDWAGTTLKYSERRRIDADAALDALAIIVERFGASESRNIPLLQTIGQGLSSNLIRRDLSVLNLQSKWEHLVARIKQLV